MVGPRAVLFLDVHRKHLLLWKVTEKVTRAGGRAGGGTRPEEKVSVALLTYQFWPLTAYFLLRVSVARTGAVACLSELDWN